MPTADQAVMPCRNLARLEAAAGDTPVVDANVALSVGWASDLLGRGSPPSITRVPLIYTSPQGRRPGAGLPASLAGCAVGVLPLEPSEAHGCRVRSARRRSVTGPPNSCDCDAQHVGALDTPRPR